MLRPDGFVGVIFLYVAPTIRYSKGMIAHHTPTNQPTTTAPPDLLSAIAAFAGTRFTSSTEAFQACLAIQLAGLIERDIMRNAVQRVERETSEDLGAVLASLDNQALQVRAIVHDCVRR